MWKPGVPSWQLAGAWLLLNSHGHPEFQDSSTTSDTGFPSVPCPPAPTRKKFLTNHSPLPNKPRFNLRNLDIKPSPCVRGHHHTRAKGHLQTPGPSPVSLQEAGHSHLTAWRTRLSSGLRLGSLVEERMPVPQLLASVFLGGRS